jgi:hypothetical protein
MERLDVHIERPEDDLALKPPDGSRGSADRPAPHPEKKAVCLTPEEERICDMATD